MFNELVDTPSYRLPDNQYTQDYNLYQLFWHYMLEQIQEKLTLTNFIYNKYIFGMPGYDYVFSQENKKDISLSVDFVKDLIGEAEYNQLCFNFLDMYNRTKELMLTKNTYNIL